MNTDTPGAPGASARGGPTLRLRTADDVIAAVPHLFGFPPRDSLVALALRGGDLVLAARFEVRDVLAEPTRLLAGLVEQSRAAAADQILTLVYGPPERLREAGDAVVRTLAGESGVCLLVDLDAGLWWRQEAGAGPGQPLQGSPMVEAWARRHCRRPVVSDRSALLDDLHPPSGRREEGLIALWAEAERGLADHPAEGRQAMESFVRSPTEAWSDKDFVLAGVLAETPEPRHLLWAALNRRTASRHFAFWSEVVRRTPLDHRVVPLAILGLIAWQIGEGALLAVCQEECVRLNPDAPVVGLLTDICQHGIHPDAWAPAWREATALAA